MRTDQIESEKQREAHRQHDEFLARNAVAFHAIECPCGVLICPVCHFRRLHYTVDVNGKAWISCMTAGCVEVIER